ncbi:MAG: DUF445 domain-containing protein [Magnetospirillum gryphiswaldense]|nr:DUF445 domain-containing protein [Magnetospirillum gryphiswaldense]
MNTKSKPFPTHLLALALLLVMAGLLVVARGLHLAPLQAFAEAALVGGIADWFAVTALFRRPLGLPIPHTALIPANQRRLGRALGDFVRDNFLAPDLVAARLKRQSPAAWLADRLSEPRLSDALARRLARLLDDGDTRAALVGLIKPGPPLARVVETVLAENWHHRAFDRVLDAASAALAEDDGMIRCRVADGSGRWVPAWVDGRLADILSRALVGIIDDLRRTDHPWRDKLRVWAQNLAERLRDDPKLAARLEKFRDQAFAESLDEIRLAPALAALLAGQGRQLAQDSAARARLDRRLIRVVERLLVPSRDAIGDFIAEVVDKWDSRTLVGKLEAQVGRDLQFIRVNGTLVGGLVGLALYGLSHLLG